MTDPASVRPVMAPLRARRSIRVRHLVRRLVESTQLVELRRDGLFERRLLTALL